MQSSARRRGKPLQPRYIGYKEVRNLGSAGVVGGTPTKIDFKLWCSISIMELALATELYEKQKNGLHVRLTLDGLKVIVKLNFSKKYSLEIESVDTQDILYEVEEVDDIDTVEKLTKAITKVRCTLEQLYYFKPSGKYILKDDKVQVFIYKVFKKFLVEDCAICFEETSVVTHCNHHCCHVCMEKIKICPVCRCDLYD